MKRTLIATYLLLLGSSTLFAAVPAADVANAINSKVAASGNKGAIEENIRVNFQISESMYREETDEIEYPGETLHYDRAEVGPYKADLACKAYALDSNWLILAGTCMRYSKDPVVANGREYKHRTGRKVISSFAPEGFYAIPASNFETNGNVMLLWTDKKENAAKLGKLPKVNVLAVSSPAKLFALSADNIFKINTARFGSDAIRERTLKSKSINGNKFQLDESLTDLSGTATDPLFLFTPTGREFLVGYNNGELAYALQIDFNDIIHTYDGRKSKDYYSLSLNDLNFIKKVVQKHRPADWKRIKQRLFYNQTAKPYFK